MSAYLPAYQGISDSTAADSIITALSNASSPQTADAAGNIIQKLASSSLLPSDVAITGAELVEAAAGNYSIYVNATIYVYTPESVHRRDTVTPAASSSGAASGALLLSSGGRKLLPVAPYLKPKSSSEPAAPLQLLAALRDSALSLVSNLQHFAVVTTHAVSDITLDVQHDSNCSHSSIPQDDANDADCASSTSSGGRRQLQATHGVTSQLSTLGSALASELGATGMTEQQLSASVDVAGVSCAGINIVSAYLE